jgi:hypothetical protein
MRLLGARNSRPAPRGARDDVGQRRAKRRVTEESYARKGLARGVQRQQLRNGLVRGVGVRDAVSHDVLRRQVGVPGGSHHQRATGCERRHRAAKAEHTTQRRREQHRAAIADSEGARYLVRMRDDVALVVQYELRGLRRARGCEDHASGAGRGRIRQQVCACRDRPVGDRVLAGDRLRHRRVVLAVHDHGFETLQRRRITFCKDRGEIDPFESRPKHQNFGARAADYIGHLVAAKAGVDGNGDGTELRAGKEACQPGRNVRQPEGDPVARRDAEPRQSVCDPARLVSEFAIRNRTVALHQHRGVERGALGKQLRQGERNRAHRWCGGMRSPRDAIES